MSSTTRPQVHSNFTLRLSNCKVTGLATTLKSAKCYLQLEVGNTVRKTAKASPQRGSISWNDEMIFDTCHSDICCIRLYLKRFPRDKLVGEVKDTVDVLLEGQRGKVTKRNLVISLNEAVDLARFPEIHFTIAIDTSIPSALDHALGQAQAQAQHSRGVAGVATGNEGQTILARTTLVALLDNIATFNDFVTAMAEIHPYGVMAWKILSLPSTIVVVQDRRDSRVMSLLGTMNDVYRLILEAEPLKNISAHRHAVEMLVKQTTECAYFVSHYFKNTDFWSRLGENIIGGVDSKIAGFEESFRSLKANFSEGVALNTELFVLRMMSDVETISADASLNDILYAKGAGFNPEKGCMDATREGIIQEITDWVNLPDSADMQRLCWLSGMAGTGKSAISHTLSQRFKKIKRLGSSFFFDASMQEERRISHLFSTMAVDLAFLDPEWKKALWNVVKDDKALRTTNSVDLQMKHLFLEPTKWLRTIGPILFVIDAVDECGDMHARGSLLQALSASISMLPSNFRVLVTSRPDNDIEGYFGSSAFVLRKRMEDLPSTEHDIRRYISRELSCFPRIKVKWPNDEWLDRLVDLSEGLFQWAFTACRFVKGDGKAGFDPVKRLAVLLSPNFSTRQSHPLDKLYLEVLRQKFSTEDPEHATQFRSVMACILAARQPLSIEALKKVVKLADDDDEALEHPVDLILRPLGSLLSGVTETSCLVLPLHTSFRDFLLDRTRSLECHVDISKEDDHFSTACFDIMQANLRFNICDLETSYLGNAEVPGLSSRIALAIPLHLSYACLFWADHLCASSLTPMMFSQTKAFFNSSFLLWLEVMSLIAAIPSASAALQNLHHISDRMDAETANFVADAIRFVSAYSAPISRSAPHIYLSALPFTPTQSRISQQYLGDFPNILSVTFGKMTTWPAILNVLEGHSSDVRSVAFSDDGTRIASGSEDSTIRIWDAQMGGLVAGPYEGHDGPVFSVAFSRDGRRVASGSDDKTVRVWDTQTGILSAGPFHHHDSVNSVSFSPCGMRVASGSSDKAIHIWDVKIGPRAALKGHLDRVNSVSFSHDGKHIASGSEDKTIRIWDAQTGAVVAGPFRGHDDGVRAVAFSYDGYLIASGSNDMTVRIWDVQSGVVVAGPFEGHGGPINSVAFSRDGRRVASGSSDNTIRIWDTHTGALVGGPYDGHNDTVTSVAFSPDGKRIASGSYDRTIRIWDAQAGAAVPGRHDGLSRSITSVAFSRDGTQLASASSDGTIRIWDAQTGALLAGPFKGHKDTVKSIAFSHDGKRVVSGSYDKTIRIWDSQTGALVGSPFEGHRDKVNSVAFSPDGTRVVSGSVDKTIRIWDVQTGDLVAGPFEGHTDWVRSVAFSHDGKRVASGSDDRTIRIWDAQTGELVAGPFKGHNGWVNSVVFSHDSNLVASGSSDMMVRIWDAQTGAIVAGPFAGHNGRINAVAFSSDGTCIASGSDDCTVRVWDVRTGALKAGPFEGHDDWVRSVAYSHDGTRVASSSDDNTIRIWVIPPEGSPAIAFRGDSKLRAGWFCGDQGELIFWVPPIHRLSLLRPSNLFVIGPNPTKLDLTNFAHGTKWAECRISSRSIMTPAC